MSINLHSSPLAAGAKLIRFPKRRDGVLPFARRRGASLVDALNLIFLRRCIFVVFALLASQAQALSYQGKTLELVDQARACYWVFFQLYDAQYFAADDVRCIQLDYLREFTQAELGEATQKIFTRRNGESAATQYQAQLDEVLRAYRAVKSGDRYQYCVAADQAQLIRDQKVVAEFVDKDFAESFMRIWVKQALDGKPDWNFSTCGDDDL